MNGYERIGRYICAQEIALVDDDGIPYWWCGCGDLVDIDDEWWAAHERCGNCCAAFGLELPLPGVS